MQYKTTVDGVDFIFDESLFENELKQLLLKYKYSNKCFLSLIILDNNDAREYLVKRLKENIDDLCSLDFSTKDIELREISKVIKQDRKPVIAYNFEEFYSTYATSHDEELNHYIEFYLSDRFKEVYKDNLTALARNQLFSSINIVRDSVFLEHNATFFMILNDEDYLEFTYEVGDDFTSYCQSKPDFNSCFINKNNISLSEYYKEKKLPLMLKKEKKLVNRVELNSKFPFS